MKTILITVLLLISSLCYAQRYDAKYDSIKTALNDSSVVMQSDTRYELNQLVFYNVASGDKIRVSSVTSDKEGNDTVAMPLRVVDGNDYKNLDTSLIIVGTNVQVPGNGTLIVDLLNPFMGKVLIRGVAFSGAKAIYIRKLGLTF